jgi:hypothetical protein
VDFEVQSFSNQIVQVEALRDSVIQAAMEGSIVANIQKAASDYGVLTPSLSTMTRQLAKPVILQTAKTISGHELARTGTCTNGQHDGGETDVDCGGGGCGGCEAGKGCAMARDCGSSLQCAAGVCSSSSTPGSMSEGASVSAGVTASAGAMADMVVGIFVCFATATAGGL